MWQHEKKNMENKLMPKNKKKIVHSRSIKARKPFLNARKKN